MELEVSIVPQEPKDDSNEGNELWVFARGEKVVKTRFEASHRSGGVDR